MNSSFRNEPAHESLGIPFHPHLHGIKSLLPKHWALIVEVRTEKCVIFGRSVSPFSTSLRHSHLRFCMGVYYVSIFLHLRVRSSLLNSPYQALVTGLSFVKTMVCHPTKLPTICYGAQVCMAPSTSFSFSCARSTSPGTTASWPPSVATTVWS